MIRRRFLGTAALALPCVLWIGFQTAAGDVIKDDRKPGFVDIPCGVSALFSLCRLEGNAVILTSVSKALPDHGIAGHSLAELKQAADALGLPLNGVRIESTDWPLDRPALVHLDRKPHGHFVVIRPVGHSGRLVQIIDGVDEPEVVEVVRLFTSPEWTGAALVPLRGRATSRVVHLAIIGVALYLIVVVGRATRQRRQSGENSSRPAKEFPLPP